MKKLISSTVLLCFMMTAFAQGNIQKGSWMLGGNATFTSTKFSDIGGSTTNIELSPNVGYFFINQLAGGINLSLTSSKEEDYDAETLWALSPFLRYYFLPPARKVNVFLEGSYGFGAFSVSGESASINQYSFMAGPAIFLTPAVALEFGIGYTSVGGELYDLMIGDGTRSNTFGLNIGFQIHLPGKR